MLKVQVLNAENLPIPTKNERKTKIYCFSTSACHYFYDSFKNDINTRNPTWNCNFDVDLFRFSVLTFKLYSSRLFSQEIFLGRLDIDFSSFLTQRSGKEILNTPNGWIRCEFPLSNCSSPNAILALSFSYVPSIIKQIQFKEFSKPFIHIWETFSPPVQSNESVVEIELLQAYSYKENKNNQNNGLYFYFNKFHPWDSVGYTSSTKSILGPTGFTQIHTLCTERITGKYNFFILNVKNYTGTITLNFVAEKTGKTTTVKDGIFIVPRTNSPQIGVFKTIDMYVEPYKKYCVPFYLFYEKKIFRDNFEFNEIPAISPIVAKQFDEEDPNFDFFDLLRSNSDFHSYIIDAAHKSINHLNCTNFLRGYVIPTSEKIPLNKLFQDNYMKTNYHLRIYLWGSTTHNTGNSSYTDKWTPEFVIYDRSTGQKCAEISKQLKKRPNLHYHLTNKKTFGLDWHTSADLNLDEIGIEKTVIFAVSCSSQLEMADPPGNIFITQVDGENERLLFRNEIHIDFSGVYFASFFRFEFVEDSWYLVPMKHCFDKEKRFNTVMDALYRSGWSIPPSTIGEMNENFGSSEKENIIEDFSTLLI